MRTTDTRTWHDRVSLIYVNFPIHLYRLASSANPQMIYLVFSISDSGTSSEILLNIGAGPTAQLLSSVSHQSGELKYGEANGIRSQDNHDVGRVRATLARLHALCSNLLRLLAYPVSLWSSRNTNSYPGRL